MGAGESTRHSCAPRCARSWAAARTTGGSRPRDGRPPAPATDRAHSSLAEGVGFEPTVGLHPRRFSRPLHSSALPPLRGGVQSSKEPAGVDDLAKFEAMDHHVSVNRLAARATTHCLIGCGIGEVLGVVIGTALGWSTAATIALAIGLAFIFGYSLTVWPLVASGVTLRAAAGLALVADTASITVMEIVDNAMLLLIPGAMDAPLDSLLFW